MSDAALEDEARIFGRYLVGGTPEPALVARYCAASRALWPAPPGVRDAALLDFVHSETRTKYPMYRKAGSDKFERVTWDFALDRIARLMKDDRDANLIEKNNDGVTVNRWTSTGFLAASATTNETAWCTYKVVRSAGMVVFDNQARV